MITPPPRRAAFLLPSLLLLLFLAACAPAVKPKLEVFWPPPPDEPRIQFLTGISNAKDLQGKTALSLVSLAAGEQEDLLIDKPFGLAVGPGKIYVSDTPKGKVWIIDLEKRSMAPLPGNFSRGKLSKPTNLALDADGNLYVADTSRKEVVLFDPQGNYLNAFGPRQQITMKPVDMAVDGERLYVADIDASEVKVLDRRSGALLDTLKGDETSATDFISMPLSLAINPKGEIHVTNGGTGRVLHLDRDGHVLHAFGGMGRSWGAFARPRGIDVDDEGKLVVVDAGHGNGQLFTNEGQLLIFFGEPGHPGGSMTLPAAVVITRDNLDYFRPFAAPDFELEQLIFVTNQYSVKSKVGVYGIGKMKASAAKISP